jgi:hypothetical protein
MMKIGHLVMLVGTDGFMPPMGVIGEIVEGFDGEDYGVEFPKHPCPVPPGTLWYVRPWMLMRINGDQTADDEDVVIAVAQEGKP